MWNPCPNGIPEMGMAAIRDLATLAAPLVTRRNFEFILGRFGPEGITLGSYLNGPQVRYEGNLPQQMVVIVEHFDARWLIGPGHFLPGYGYGIFLAQRIPLVLNGWDTIRSFRISPATPLEEGDYIQITTYFYYPDINW